MLLPMFHTTRQYLPRILWYGVLFAVSGRCATDAAGVSTSEVLIIGTPVRHDLATRTVTITIAYKPTLAPGVSSYSLSGCYGHTGIDQRGGHPFGTERDYATPSSLDPGKLTVASCLEACATVPRQSNTEERFGFVGIKNGSECYCSRKLDKNAVELSASNCTTACPGDPKLSCGGPCALVIYSLGTSSETVKSTASSTGTSQHTSHTDPLRIAASHPLSHGSLPPPPLPSETKVGGDRSSDKGGQPSSGTPKATTIAAISGSTSGAVLLSVIVYFGIRACKRRRREQDAHVAGILTKSINTGQHNLPGPTRSPSRGRTLTRAFLPPPLTGLHTPGAESEGRRGGRTRAAFLSTMRGQIPAPLPPTLSTTDLPPARASEEGDDGGHSSAVQWRPGDRAAGAAMCCAPSPRSPWREAPAPPSPAATAQPASSLGDRAWHRRRLSTPYAPPTVPLPPTPPIVRQKKKMAAAAAAMAAGPRPLAPPASGARSPTTMTTAPLRPGRKQTAASLETGSPGRRTPPRGPQDVEAAPPPHLEFLPSTTYLADREPTIPVLPPIAAGARIEFGAAGWNAGEVSPATTVDTDILYRPPTPLGGGGVGKGAEEHGGRL